MGALMRFARNCAWKFHRTSHRPDLADVDDLFQSGMEGAVKAWHTWDSEKSRWIHYAMNKIYVAMIEELRRIFGRRTSAKRPEVSSLDAMMFSDESSVQLESIAPLVSYDPEPSDPYLMRAIDNMVSLLPLREQVVIDLIYLKGHTVPEAAAILGYTPASLAVMLSNARAKLRQDPRKAALV